LPLEEKQSTRIGLAIVDRESCLPFAQKAACQLCVEACKRAGYGAIEFVRVGTEVDATGKPIADTGFLAPAVRADRCVGCGLCQTRCHSVNVRQQSFLTRSAILIEAGARREDRVRNGSRHTPEQAGAERRKAASKLLEHDNSYLPEATK
jgi:ferredoxin